MTIAIWETKFSELYLSESSETLTSEIDNSIIDSRSFISQILCHTVVFATT